MFTGLIEDIGAVKFISDSKIEIETSLDDISQGDSISVNGICLTATKIFEYGFQADFSVNTFKITSLSKLKIKSKVNLERALKLSSRLGGHLVSGHIDGIGEIKKIENFGNSHKFSFLCKENIVKYCVDKGSIAIDGVSLTVSAIIDFIVEVFIIPETFNKTNFYFKKAGEIVNIETDILAKYVENFTNKKTKSINFETLLKRGFIDEK
jgi:riboflavin synthase